MKICSVDFTTNCYKCQKLIPNCHNFPSWNTLTKTTSPTIISCSQTLDLEGSDTHKNSVRDFEISRFPERFLDFSRFLLGFPDFTLDFWISVKISRFRSRFPDFGQNFRISVKISRFHKVSKTQTMTYACPKLNHTHKFY